MALIANTFFIAEAAGGVRVETDMPDTEPVPTWIDPDYGVCVGPKGYSGPALCSGVKLGTEKGSTLIHYDAETGKRYIELPNGGILSE